MTCHFNSLARASQSRRYLISVFGAFSSSSFPPCSWATSKALSLSTFRKFRSNGCVERLLGLNASEAPWSTPRAGASGPISPDQLNGSDFSPAGEANTALQKPDFPSCPLLPFMVCDSSRMGMESDAHRRAGLSIFCRAKRPVSSVAAGGAGFTVGADELSHPATNTVRAEIRNKNNEVRLRFIGVLFFKECLFEKARTQRPAVRLTPG